MKQFGITKPRSFDYFLAFAFALLATSSILVGLWVTFGEGWDLSFAAIDLSLRALAGMFSGPFMPFVAIMSAIFYLAVLFSLTMLVFAIFKKDCKAVAGAFALVLYAAAFACQIGFILTFYSYFNGLFVSALAFFMLFELILAVMDIRLLWYRLIIDTKFYEEYVMDFPEAECFEECCCEDCECEEHKEPKKEVKQEQKELVKEEPKEEVKEEKIEESKEETAETDGEEDEGLEADGEEDGESDGGEFSGMKAKLLSFEQKLNNAKPIARERFEDLKAYFESLGFKAVRTKHAETFVHKNSKYAQVTISGKSGLKVYYKLDTKDYADSAIPVVNVENVKKYEKTPLLFSVKSDLSVKRAKKLMDDVAKNMEK